MDFITFLELVVAQTFNSKRKFVPVHVKKAYRGSRGTAPLIRSLGQQHSPAPLSLAKNTGINRGRLSEPYSGFGVLEKKGYLSYARIRTQYHPACRLVAIRTEQYHVLNRNTKRVQKCFAVLCRQTILSLTCRTAPGPNQIPIHRIPAVFSTDRAV
jgi:hypothetical protein